MDSAGTKAAHLAVGTLQGSSGLHLQHDRSTQSTVLKVSLSPKDGPDLLGHP